MKQDFHQIIFYIQRSPSVHWTVSVNLRLTNVSETRPYRNISDNRCKFSFYNMETCCYGFWIIGPVNLWAFVQVPKLLSYMLVCDDWNNKCFRESIYIFEQHLLECKTLTYKKFKHSYLTASVTIHGLLPLLLLLLWIWNLGFSSSQFSCIYTYFQTSLNRIAC